MKDFRSLKVWERARDLGYLDIKTYEGLNNQAVEVKRMLTGFIQKLIADY
ncbi:MAG: hypothetical protein GH152_01420 [Dehalococcoidia bacterium]|nr:hypothetical protein [Dehalococcoidia bacterium]